MSLIITAGGRDSDSYATVAEMSTYMKGMYPEAVIEDWDSLETSNKEYCLRIAVLFIDELSYRGHKACRDQALQFPRWWRTDVNYPSYEDQYIDMTDIPNYATPTASDRNNLYGSPPIVPEAIKKAQMEMGLRVVHGQLLKSDAELMDYPEHEVRSFTLGGGMTIDFFSQASGETHAWGKAKFTATSIAQAYLNKWIRHFVGAVV